MAYKDSEELKSDESYALGEYSFRIERSSVPGSTNDQITAICIQGGKNARKSIQIPSVQNTEGWYVEANGTTADVYAIIKVPSGVDEYESTIDVSVLPRAEGYPQPIPTGNSIVYIGLDHGVPHEKAPGWPERTQTTTGMMWISKHDGVYVWGVASRSPGTITFIEDNGETIRTTTENLSPAVTLLGTPYYHRSSLQSVSETGYSVSGVIFQTDQHHNEQEVIETIIIDGVTRPVNPEYEEKEMLVGRFAIELEDAGGVGPGSDWYDPGDYDPDWEEGDPTHTLYVEVTGALSGRHNDPIVDPSYSYIPADKDTVKDYGCGGDGGNGGGGGAGASTVVIHKFATNQANSKEVTAIARRHGYGSGGGKGGKGGDGCILVYY